MKRVIVSGAFDDVRFADFRFLEEAAKLGHLHVLLWPDAQIRTPKFPLPEREYVLAAIRHVGGLTISAEMDGTDSLPADDLGNVDIWAVNEESDTPAKRFWCQRRGIDYAVISDAILNVAPPAPPTPVNPRSERKKVVVTGCFDWFHSGHVRFFEEVSELGDLYVVVGHDENIRLLKGAGHPLFPATQRRYMAGSIRFVKQALISSGAGWMDAEPEFVLIKPDIYAVNEDGDKPEKRQFCERYGIEYRVLKRLPKDGLPRRQSTNLRGF